jgi:SAM-dependent methyltransferase
MDELEALLRGEVVVVEAGAERAPEPAATLDRLGGHLWDLDQHKQLDASAVIESRRPLVGGLIVRAQRLVRRLTGWYLLPILEQIRLFEADTAGALRALETLARRLDDVETLRTVQTDLLNRDRILSRLDRLERLVQALRLAGADLPERAFLGTRSVVSRAPTGFDYRAFEDRFRGPPELIRARQAPLVDLFRGPDGPVLHIGCGRGEFLSLMAAAGLDAYGIEESPELVADCRDAGLDAFRDDAITHLAGLDDAHLGGILASHVVEHLPAPELWQLFQLAAAKLRPGGAFVMESPNPRVLAVSGTTFWLDPTHVRPVHPDTARFLLEQLGFTGIEIRYQMPFPEEDQLPRLDAPASGDALEVRLNALIDRLNDLLFGARDYLLIARRA